MPVKNRARNTNGGLLGYITSLDEKERQVIEESVNAYSKIEVDDLLANKLNLNTEISASQEVYGKEANATQQMIPVDSAPTANTIAYRSTGGTLQVGNATADNHAITKGQVDALVGDKVSKTTAETISGQKTFSQPIKTNEINTVNSSDLFRLFAQAAIQIQSGAKELWLDGAANAFFSGAPMDLGKADKLFKNLRLSENAYAASFRAVIANNPVELRGNAVELVATEVGTDTVKSKMTLSAADSTHEAAFYPWDNEILNLGTSTYKFKDIHTKKVSGHELPTGNAKLVSETELAAKQNISKMLRVDAADTAIATNEYTDIFAISGSVILNAGFDSKSVKTFYVNKGVEIKAGTSGITKINVDFSEKNLPYVAEDKMYLVGKTTDDCLMFHNENLVILTSPNNTKYKIKVADDGQLSTEVVS